MSAKPRSNVINAGELFLSAFLRYVIVGAAVHAVVSKSPHIMTIVSSTSTNSKGRLS